MSEIYQYPKCSTCKKALKWLKDNDVNIRVKDITLETPSKEELIEIIEKSKMDIKKFFNTSGKIYKERGLKNVVDQLSVEEAAEMLSKEGMLIKRPLYVSDHTVITGFKEEVYKTLK